MKQLKKHKAKLFLSMLFLAFCMMPKTALAAENAEFSYTDNADATITITGYSGSNPAVVIPDTINGKMVTAIADGAFSTKDITCVTLPKTVVTIGKQAFRYCVNLQTVTLLDTSLTTIGDEAFAYCTKLQEVKLPQTVTTVGDSAFANIGTISTYETDALSITYGKKVFAGTKIKKLICKQSSTTYTYAENIAAEIAYSGPYLSELSGTLNVGSQMTLTLNGAAGETTYTSSEKAVATVDEAGVITALKAGKTVISVTNSGETLSYELTVTALKLNHKTATITIGYTVKLTVKNAAAVTFSSSNSKVASVSSKGVVKGRKKGTATIAAKVEKETYKCKVKVVENKATINKYSTNAYSYNGGVLGFSTVSKTSKGYTIKGHFINGTSNKIKGIKNMTVTVKAGGKVIAKKKISNLKLNLPARRTKAITYHFTGSQVKKKVDLRKYKTISVSVSGAKYYYEKTITVPVSE